MPRRPAFFKPPAGPSAKRPRADKVERDAFYTSARWMKLRATFLRANPLCADCLARDILTPATIAHHKAERLQCPDKALDMDNLEALCSPCHTKRHKKG